MTSYPELHMLLDGERVSGEGREARLIRNPATEAVIGELPLATAADLDRALAAAQRGFRLWRDAPAEQRAQVLATAARLLMERQESLASIATMEEGKSLNETRTEVMMVANLFNFYAGECQRLFGRPSSSGRDSARRWLTRRSARASRPGCLGSTLPCSSGQTRPSGASNGPGMAMRVARKACMRAGNQGST